MSIVNGRSGTGTKGVESVASVARRRLLAGRPKLAQELGLGPITPHFFHLTATDAYLETVDGELCVTRWQGIPIVRYNLHDRAVLLAWGPLRHAILTSAPEGLDDVELRGLIQEAEEMPDLLAISGRTDNAVTIGGTKLTEAMLDEVVACAALSDLLTGSYRAALIFEADRPILSIDLEFKPDICLDTSVLDRAYGELIHALCRVQPEFASDWENVYRLWDDDPSLRVLRLRALAWPALSQMSEQRTKAKSLEPSV